MAASGEKHSPLEQFEIIPFVHMKAGGVDLSFTNSSLSMIITVAVITLFLTLTVNTRSIIPSRLQLISELMYTFIAQLLSDTVGDNGRRYFPFVFSLFMFVLIGNMVGMVPYQFTFTSHIIVTFALASVVFIGVTILGFINHGIRFFTFFYIPGVPFYMHPLLIPIEVISYLSRPISLSVRLFANMLAGHTLLKVFAGFVVSMPFFTGALPLTFIVALTGLEILIAFLQAYVFAILTCLYINDAYHLH
ncbi:MAG: ATP synthase subunit a [Alphaproteobacteria bacterium MarineAlpha5_Bin8]|nr:MAG: ATP synthase subunit a [Alphaproteobacteria bacterium MarineAlpha5_Bin8]PPR53222.1 MAG: ATP synthase subunit a [Alphaproteobacteria bacterium MarineAlpha5_Bin6]|tara:strand:+ start:2844 stop:3587 length:744 start_codon:yes stop_codon:yes gene_type:complete